MMSVALLPILITCTNLVYQYIYHFSVQQLGWCEVRTSHVYGDFALCLLSSQSKAFQRHNSGEPTVVSQQCQHYKCGNKFQTDCVKVNSNDKELTDFVLVTLVSAHWFRATGKHVCRC